MTEQQIAILAGMFAVMLGLSIHFRSRFCAVFSVVCCALAFGSMLEPGVVGPWVIWPALIIGLLAIIAIVAGIVGNLSLLAYWSLRDRWGRWRQRREAARQRRVRGRNLRLVE